MFSKKKVFYVNYLDVRDELADSGYWLSGKDEGDVSDPVHALGVWENRQNQKLVVYPCISEEVPKGRGYLVRLKKQNNTEEYREKSSRAVLETINAIEKRLNGSGESSWNQTAEAMND